MRKIFTIAAAALLTTSAFAAGEVYRWKDASGTWHYSDQPQPGAELVTRVRPANAAPDAPAPAPVADRTTPATASEALPLSKDVTQQVRQEAATAKAEQCEKAKVEYDKSVRAQGMYKLDASGNRVFLSPAEIDAARLEARSARDLACGS